MHQIPSSFPALFSGDSLVVYGVLKSSENANEGDDNVVRLEGMLGNDEKVQHLVKFSAPPIAVGHRGNALLHQLETKSFIQEKQDGYSERNDVQENEEAKCSTISISKSANVVSKFTSFVAVDKDSNQPVSGPLRKYFVSLSPTCADFSMPMVMPVGSFISGGASPFQPTYSTHKPTSPEQCSLPPDFSERMAMPMRSSFISGGASPFQLTYFTHKPTPPEQCSLPPDLSGPMVMPSDSLICAGASPLQPTYSTLKLRPPEQCSLPPDFSERMAMPMRSSFISGGASPFQATYSTHKPTPPEQCSLPPDLSRPMIMPSDSLICGGASPLQPTYSALEPRRPVQCSLPPMYPASSCGPPPNKKSRFDLTGFKAAPETEVSTRRFNWKLQEILGGSHRSLNDFPPGSGSILQKKKDSPPVLALVTLQKASGSWDLTDQLVSLCGTGRDASIKGCPKEIAVDTGKGELLWATALALVLLMGKFLDQRDEWEMIAEKGSKWMKKHLPAGVKYVNVLEAAATTVGVQVQLGQ